MKILWLGRNDEKCISSRLYYLRKALSKIVEVQCMGPGYPNYEPDIPKLVRENDIDAIVLRGGPAIRWNVNNPYFHDLDKVRVPKGLIHSDPQTQRDVRINWINKRKIDVTFHTYKQVRRHPREKWKYSMEEFQDLVFPGHKAVWLPNAVDAEVFHDMNLDRIYDVCLLGRVYWLYPLRKVIWIRLGAIPDPPADLIDDFKIFYRKRPKRSWGWTKEETLMQDSYAEILNRCKGMLFDSSMYGLGLTKYFETMATGTLALADCPVDAEDLHFKPGFNFVEINKDNFMDKTRYYLENPKERLKITDNGIETIQQYHTTDIRAKQLLNHLSSLFS